MGENGGAGNFPSTLIHKEVLPWLARGLCWGPSHLPKLILIKGTVHLKLIKKTLSSFTLPHVVPNLWDFLSAVMHKWRNVLLFFYEITMNELSHWWKWCKSTIKVVHINSALCKCCYVTVVKMIFSWNRGLCKSFSVSCTYQSIHFIRLQYIVRSHGY